MSLLGFYDIRFCDPILALDVTPKSAAYGSTTGRLVYVCFVEEVEVVLCENSEEAIKGIWISEENYLFAAVGDIGYLIVD